MDCIQAQRPVPCDLCCTRYKLPYNPCQFPSSSDETTLPPFTVPSTASKTRKPRKKADNLKKVELEEVERALATYEQQLYAEERLVAPHRYRPRSLYFPNALQEAIASDLLKIKSCAALNVILALNSWPFIELQGSNLFDYISSLQKTVHSQRKVKSKKSTKKSKSLSDLSDGLSDIEKSSSDIDAVNLPPLNPSKRVALAPANNQPHAKRKPQPRQAQQSLAEAESYYARPVGKSYARAQGSVENAPPFAGVQRRSTRLQKKCKHLIVIGFTNTELFSTRIFLQLTSSVCILIASFIVGISFSLKHLFNIGIPLVNQSP